MKKVFLGAVLLMMIGAAHASAAVPFTQESKIHVRQNILSSQLPASLQADIKRDYKDYWITALSEEVKGKHSDYYITLENADQVVELRASDSGSWEMTSTSLKG